MTGLWTIGELAMEVRQALASAAYPGQKSGRVRDVPDRRTIRYYTTIGLLDKPSEMRARTAYYSRRHLLQLVAIKRLQAQGKSLVEIQAALAGAGDSALAKWSALPESSGVSHVFKQKPVTPGESAGVADIEGPSLPEREDFWSVSPQAEVRAAKTKRKAPTDARTALHLTVLENVTLVIEGVDADTMDAESLADLQPALEILRKALQKNGGIVGQTPRNGKEPTKEADQSHANENEREQQ